MEKASTALKPSYHLVLPEFSRYTYSITAKAFDAQLATVAKYRPSLPGDCALAFDDGHVSQHDYGFPLVQKHGLRAIFFSIVGWIGKRTDYMTWQQLRELVSAGHDVQSHGLSHIPLTHCGDQQLANELGHSRSELEQKLGVAINAISIPFGRWDVRVMRACALAGYRRVYTSDPVAQSWICGVETVGRFAVSRRTTADRLSKVLSGDARTLRRLRTEHRSKLLLRAVIGERSYDRIWGILGSRDSEVPAVGVQAEF